MYSIRAVVGYVNCLLVTGVLAVTLNGNAEADGTPFDNEAVIRKYSGSVVRESDLNDDVRAFLRRKPVTKTPGYLYTDINGDGKMDVALLVQDRRQRQVSLLVFICKDSCKLQKKELVGAPGDIFLQLVERDTVIEETEALPGQPKEVRLQAPGIKVLNFGKSEIVYFWDVTTGTVRSLTTAD
jgi:hypothetical protein